MIVTRCRYAEMAVAELALDDVDEWHFATSRCSGSCSCARRALDYDAVQISSAGARCQSVRGLDKRPDVGAISAGTVSTTLTKMAKAGELTKAQRGYRLPG